MKKILILILIALPCAATVFAQPQQSENFRITKSVLDAGGGASTSANFQLVSAFGQPTPVGISSSSNFVLSAGFLSPEFAASPLSPIADLVIRRQPSSANVKLDWTAVPGAGRYVIHRHTNPLFIPTPADSVGGSLSNSFTDVNVVNLPALKYFYIVTSVNGGNDPMAVQPEKKRRTISAEQN